MPISIDKRILKSRRALLRAMPALLRDKPLEKITVREIADAAGINRKTFYAHYDTPADLHRDLAHKVADAVMRRMEGLTATRIADFTGAIRKMAQDYPEEFILFVKGENLFALRHMVFERLCDILTPMLFSENSNGRLLTASMIGSTLALYAANSSLDVPLSPSTLEDIHLQCLAQGLA